jgi:hypothetical protein
MNRDKKVEAQKWLEKAKGDLRVRYFKLAAAQRCRAGGYNNSLTPGIFMFFPSTKI